MGLEIPSIVFHWPPDGRVWIGEMGLADVAAACFDCTVLSGEGCEAGR
jgi:hypothetical protein